MFERAKPMLGPLKSMSQVEGLDDQKQGGNMRWRFRIGNYTQVKLLGLNENNEFHINLFKNALFYAIFYLVLRACSACVWVQDIGPCVASLAVLLAEKKSGGSLRIEGVRCVY